MKKEITPADFTAQEIACFESMRLKLNELNAAIARGEEMGVLPYTTEEIAAYSLYCEVINGAQAKTFYQQYLTEKL